MPSEIVLKKQSTVSIPTPDTDKAAFFINTDGYAPSLKSDAGILVGMGRNVGGVVTPAQIVANADNYAGTDGYDWARLNTDASRNITGIVAATDGIRKLLSNVGAFNIVLVHNATSTAANQFLCPNSANLTLTPNSSVWIVYDGTSSRWRVLGVA